MTLHYAWLALIAISLFFILHAPPLVNAAPQPHLVRPLPVNRPTKPLPEVVKHVCFHCKEPDLCDQVFRGNPKSLSISTLPDIAKFITELATNEAQKARGLIDNMLKNHNYKFENGPAIELCSFSYNKVLEALGMSLKQQPQDIKSATFGILIAEDFTRYCQLALNSSGVKFPSLMATNAMLKLFVSIVDATNQAVEKNIPIPTPKTH